MYKLYKDTGDPSEPYIIAHNNKCISWFSSLQRIPTEFEYDYTPYVLEKSKQHAYGEVILLYESKEQPTTEYLQKNHPELFV